MTKQFVAVRAAYYKHAAITKNIKRKVKLDSQDKELGQNTKFKERKYKSALSELEHVLRTGKTNSVNVFSEFSNNNIIFSPQNTTSPMDAYFKCMDRYKEKVGRKCRKDMNTLFEHVVILSDDHVKYLENRFGKSRVHKKIEQSLIQYSKKFSEEFGFTSLGGTLHLDEGHYDEQGNFKRNVHAHIMFFNYDFKNGESNLRKLFNKGLDSETGKTNELNENFVKIQDLAFECFKNLKFKRGKSKLLTLRDYLTKSEYLKKKINDLKMEYRDVENKVIASKESLKRYFTGWFESLVKGRKVEVDESFVFDEADGLEQDAFVKLVSEKTKRIETKIRKYE